MPIDYEIDRRRRVVRATPRGTLTHQDMIEYQKTVWSRPSLRNYDELIDMSDVAGIEFESPQDVMQLAELSAGMDDPRRRTKLAIVASDKLHHALGRMYRAYRDQSPGANRQVEVFRSAEEALQWLRPPKASRTAKRK